MSPEVQEKLKIINSLLEEVKFAPTLSNWGIVAFEKGIFVFSNKSSYYQSLLKENGELEMTNLSNIPLAQIVPYPLYRSVPIIKGVVTEQKIAFGFGANEKQLEIICSELRNRSHWGNENINAFQSPDHAQLIFNVNEYIYQINSADFSLLTTNSSILVAESA